MDQNIHVRDQGNQGQADVVSGEQVAYTYL